MKYNTEPLSLNRQSQMGERLFLCFKIKTNRRKNMKPKPKSKPKSKSKKQKHKTTRIHNKWTGYFLEDIECKFCPNYLGKKKGCKYSKCQFDEEKQDAVANGRIKREKRIGRWDL
jgi:hypothetical protein